MRGGTTHIDGRVSVRGILTAPQEELIGVIGAKELDIDGKEWIVEFLHDKNEYGVRYFAVYLSLRNRNKECDLEDGKAETEVESIFKEYVELTSPLKKSLKILRWIAKPGDIVTPGKPLAEVEFYDLPEGSVTLNGKPIATHFCLASVVHTNPTKYVLKATYGKKSVEVIRQVSIRTCIECHNPLTDGFNYVINWKNGKADKEIHADCNSAYSSKKGRWVTTFNK